jgi:hypothetical protein
VGVSVRWLSGARLDLPSRIYTIEVIPEIDLESEVEAWLLALPYGHYQRVMRNVDDYLVTGGIPDGQLIILLTFFRKTRDGTQRADVDDPSEL